MSLNFEERHLRGFDPDSLAHVLDSSDLEHRLLAAGDLHVHSSQLHWGDVSISVCEYSFPVLARGGMPFDGGVFIGIPGKVLGGVSLNLQPLLMDQILLYAPGSEAHYHARAASEWMMLRLPLDRLREAAAERQGLDLSWPRQGVSHVDIPSECGARLRRDLRGLLQFGRRVAGMPEAELIQPLVRDGLLQVAVEAIACGSDTSTPKLSIGRTRALTTMESSIESWMKNPDSNLRVADIKGASQRMLEMASREIYGMTPHHWLKLARLNAAYRELCSGRCTSVTDVCVKLGLGNMGRFAMEYRRLFGESPRETLSQH